MGKQKSLDVGELSQFFAPAKIISGFRNIDLSMAGRMVDLKMS